MSSINERFIEAVHERIKHHGLTPTQIGRAMGGSDRLACQRGHLLIKHPATGRIALTYAVRVCDAVGLDLVAKRKGKPAGRRGQLVEEVRAQLDADERTVAWLARLVGLYRQQVNQWMKGNGINLESVAVLCDALDIEILIRPRKGWAPPEVSK